MNYFYDVLEHKQIQVCAIKMITVTRTIIAVFFVNFLRSVLKCRFQDNFFSQNYKKVGNVQHRYNNSRFLYENITSLSKVLSILGNTLTRNVHFNCRFPFCIQDLSGAVAPSSVQLA